MNRYFHRVQTTVAYEVIANRGWTKLKIANIYEKMKLHADVLSKLHEERNSDWHHNTPDADKQVCWAVAQVIIAYRAMLNVILDERASINCSTLLVAGTRNLFHALNWIKKLFI